MLTGDCNQFIDSVKDALKHLYISKALFLICGNINTIISLKEPRRKQLASLLKKYNLKYAIYCATRIQNNSNIAIDNIIVDNSELNVSSVSPTISGLSHHNTQILTFKLVYATTDRFTFHECVTKSVRCGRSHEHTYIHTYIHSIEPKTVIRQWDVEHVIIIKTCKIYSLKYNVEI